MLETQQRRKVTRGEQPSVFAYVLTHIFKKILCVHAELAQSFLILSNHEMKNMRIFNSCIFCKYLKKTE